MRLLLQQYRDPRVPAPGAYEPDLPPLKPKRRGAFGPDFIDDSLRNGLAFLLIRLKSHQAYVGRVGETYCNTSSAPATFQHLSAALVEEWNALPEELLTNLEANKGARCRVCIAVHCDHTIKNHVPLL
ncbi:uncharacterized protein LOC126092580 [Schistocerca cancellata]|uniref:uncharacterized protein LOC126092580 n=1 Tax=Schistocerca cancellata TaxID=274614 RepID=UPI0021185A16|nr:uncharacterized protein LOC126092580 [Schistocerca cancellata]